MKAKISKTTTDNTKNSSGVQVTFRWQIKSGKCHNSRS